MVELTIKDDKVSFRGLVTERGENSFCPTLSSIIDYDDFKSKIKRRDFTAGSYHLQPKTYQFLDTSMISLLVYSDDYNRESIPMQVSSIDIFTLPNGQQQLFMLKKYYSSLDSETALRPYVYEIQQGEL